jgi:AraC-like DNA-binding protein
VEVHNGPVVALSGPELWPLDRHLRDAVRMFRRRDGITPYEFLQLAIAVNQAVTGSATEPRNPPVTMNEALSDQPVTLTVKQAATRMEVSESYVRRLVRHEILEVLPSQGPTRIYADSVAAHQERRHRKDKRKAA